MRIKSCFIIIFLCGAFAALACPLHSKEKSTDAVLSFGTALEDAKLVFKMGPAAGNAPLGPVSKEGGIEGLYPLYGALMLSESLEFKWSGKKISGEHPFLFIFENENEKPKTFSIQSKEKKKKIVSRELGLKKGKTYHWYLGNAEAQGPIAQSRVFSFRILSAEEEKMLTADLKEVAGRPLPRKDCRDFLKAQVFYKYALYHDMVEVLQPLYKMAHTEPLKQLLFLGNVRLGRYAEAKKFKTR